MLELDAPIEPGRGLGGIAIGCAVDDILAHAKPLRVVELPGDDEDPQGVTIHSFGAIRTWSVAGIVVQVGAFEGYAGRTATGIGVGSTVAEIEAAHEDVVPHDAEGIVVLPDTPGVGIETTEWSTKDEPDPAATIVQIFVHATAG
jgi:hypothetical protein